jgi:hypothetical protein
MVMQRGVKNNAVEDVEVIRIEEILNTLMSESKIEVLK